MHVCHWAWKATVRIAPLWRKEKFRIEPIVCRPSRSRISQLEEENQRLRQQLVSSDTGSNHEERPKLPGTDQPPDPIVQNQEPAKRDQPRSTVSRIFISPNGDSSYHGLTSTLFDDTPTDRRGLHDASANLASMPVEYISKSLMGEAAYQRRN